MNRYAVFAVFVIALGLYTPDFLIAQSKPAGVEGTYSLEVVADGQATTNLTLVIKRSGDKLVAESSGSQDLVISGIVLDADKVTLKAAWQGTSFDLPGTITDGNMGGKWKNDFVGGTWSAKRRP